MLVFEVKKGWKIEKTWVFIVQRAVGTTTRRNAKSFFYRQ
jgi:hypothetical protein